MLMMAAECGCSADRPLHLFPALLRSSDSIRSIFQSVFRIISIGLIIHHSDQCTTALSGVGLPLIVDLNYRPIKPIKLIVEAIPGLLCYVA